VSASGKQISLTSVFEGVGAHKSGNMSAEELLDIEMNACPTCGSCSGMFTANSMNCLMEMLGMALPGNGTIVATSEKRKELVYEAARQLVRMIKEDVKPRDIITKEAIDDAFELDMAMSESKNTVLHTLEIVNEAEIDYDMEDINKVAEKVTYLAKIMPASDISMDDINKAGGVEAIINELTKIPGAIHPDRITVSGKTMGEIVAPHEISNPEVIRTKDNPYSPV